jgi:hypothetical protein
MVIAMIFGAHLLPFGWLYNSKTYMGLKEKGIMQIIEIIVDNKKYQIEWAL